MDVNTRHKTFRLHFIDECLRQVSFVTKANVLERLNAALTEAFDETKTIGNRTFEEDWKWIKTNLEDNGHTLKGRKEGKQWKYRYSDIEFTIDDATLSKKEIKRLHDAVNLLQQIKGIDVSHELTDILQKMGNRIKSQNPKAAAAIGFQQTEAASGYQYVDDLYDAIIEKTVVAITYQPYGKEAITKNISPYHLRQYNNRWFLFGWDDDLKRVTNLPLDRILKAPKGTHEVYKDAAGIFDAATYFEPIIGVTRFANRPVETIVLQVSQQRAPYLITKPLHATQQHELLASGNYQLTLQLSINNELTQLLLGFGSALQVIAPESLRLFMKEEAEKMLKKYEE